MNRLLGLTPRLLAAAGWIRPGDRVADIGTDHARLPAYLVQRGVTERVIATDIADGPLARARRTLSVHGLCGRVELRRCDGAGGLAPDEIDAAVITGMGGETILGILRRSPWLKEKRVIVQPQTRQLALPGWMEAEGYVLRESGQAAEGRRLYRLYLFER